MQLASFCLLAASIVAEFSFPLYSGKPKCFGEELGKSELMVIKAEASSNKPLQLRVFSGVNENEALTLSKKNLDKSKVVFESLDKSSVQHALTSANAGPHWLCVETSETSSEVTLSVRTGVQARDYSQLAKKDGLDASQTALTQITDALKSYYSNLIYMREREDRMRQTYDLAAGKIITASAVSLVLVILAAGAQMLYFKRFFRTKKII